jgi:hypothetical protein
MAVMAILRQTLFKLLNPLRQLRNRFVSLPQSCSQLFYLLIFVHTLTVPEVTLKYNLLALLSSYLTFYDMQSVRSG